MNLVPVPRMAPRRCFFCVGNAGGRHVDTMFDHPLPVIGRVYVCLKHSEQIAAAAGFAEGEELEKLKNAAVLLDQAREDLRKQSERLHKIDTERLDARAELERVTEERDHEAGRADQAEQTLKDVRASIDATANAVQAA